MVIFSAATVFEFFFEVNMSVIAMYPEEFPASPFRADILLGRRAVISGGGSGIGFEIARQLGLHGAAVCIMGRREHVLRDSAEKLRADGVGQVTFCSGDVRPNKRFTSFDFTFGINSLSSDVVFCFLFLSCCRCVHAQRYATLIHAQL